MEKKKLIVISLLVLFIFGSCSFFSLSPEDDIVGTWLMTFFVTSTYEFKSDNSFLITYYDDTTESGTWEATEKTLTLTYSDDSSEDIPYTMSNDKNSMSWTNTDVGITLTLTRVN
jgi:hypothetical protein